MSGYKNIVRLKVIAKALEEISHKVVFVGGAVVDLYCDDMARGEVRPTLDIDVVVELINRTSYASLEDKLRNIGFQNDIESSVICRYKYHDMIVDIMPDDEKILGFTNLWYKEGLENSISFALDNEQQISIFTAAHFIASKIEALKSERHGRDYRLNSDFEDIIYLFDNRTTILEDILMANDDVKQYLKIALATLLHRPTIEEEIMANLEPQNNLERSHRIMAIWLAIVA